MAATEKAAARHRSRAAHTSPCLTLASLPRYSHGMKNAEPGGVLDRFLDPLSRSFTRESAQALVELKADQVAQARIEELAEKCNEGQLTPEERREYETYVHAGDLIGIDRKSVV